MRAASNTIDRPGGTMWDRVRPLMQIASLLALLAAGCQQSPGTVVVEVDRRHRLLLLSDIARSDRPEELLDSEFVFRNTTSSDVRLRYEGAGCACYKVTALGRPLERGEEQLIAAGEARAVQIGITPPTAAGERQYTARFEWLKADGQTLPLPVSLTVPAVADLSVTPSVLTVGYRTGEPIAPRELKVTMHSRRRADVATAPIIDGCPDVAQADDWTLLGLDEVAAGLWCAHWTTDLQVTLPEDFRESLTSLLTVGFAADHAAPHRSSRLSLLIQPQFGIRSPGPVRLGIVPSDRDVRRRVLLAAADDVPFRILNVTSNDPRCSAKAASDEPATRHWLEVQAGVTHDERLEVELTCSTDHPESPTVPLAVTVRSARLHGLLGDEP